MSFSSRQRPSANTNFVGDKVCGFWQKIYPFSIGLHIVPLKGIFPEMERYGKEEFDHVLHCISSFIDDFTFKVRNSRYRGDILKRTISNDCLKVFNLGDEKVILTVSFTPAGNMKPTI